MNWGGALEGQVFNEGTPASLPLPTEPPLLSLQIFHTC